MKKLLFVALGLASFAPLLGKLTIYNNIETKEEFGLPFKVKFYDQNKIEIKDAKSDLLELVSEVFVPDNAEYIQAYVCKKTYFGIGGCNTEIKNKTMSDVQRLDELKSVSEARKGGWTNYSLYVGFKNNKLFFSSDNIESSK